MSPLCRLVLTLAILAPPGAGGEVHVDKVRGFRIEVPTGWTPVEQDQADGSHVLYLLPPGTKGEVLVGVTHRELAAGLGAADLLQGALAKIAGAPADFSVPQEGEVERLGRSCPTLSVVFSSPQLGKLRIDATFLAEGGRGYTLQAVAPPAAFDQWAEQLAEALSTFALLEPSAAALRVKRLRELASRCGSEVEWAGSWEAAAARARELGRPVLVVLWLYRGFELPLDPRATVFMDEDVIALVNRRYVPYWHTVGAKAAFADRYGLSATSFGRALMVVSPEGEVLAETEQATETDAAYAFLRAALPSLPAATWEGSKSFEAEHEALASGELEVALERLARVDSRPACLMRAHALRLLRRGEEALEALQRAGELDPGEPIGYESFLLLETARLCLRLERPASARAACERIREEFGMLQGQPWEGALEAQVLLALLDLQEGQREGARVRLEGLVDQHPESRWAWQAAALLSGGLLEIDVPLDFGWPDEVVLREAVAVPEPGPLAVDHVREAREDALAWLLAAQRQDGSWISPTELGSAGGDAPSPFVDAITALAARALLAHGDDPRVQPSVERGLAFLLASIERRKSSPTPVLYMDYTPWSDAAMLDTLAAALTAGLGPQDVLRSAAGELVADLSARAQPHGGWGYYVTGDLGGKAAPPTSMSFTTAAAVLALAHARAAGLEVPDEVLEDKGVAALQSMRDRDGVFAYSLQPGGPAGVASGMVPGAAGRSPACELALLRADASDAQRVLGALQMFSAHAGALAAQQGKVIMHAGEQAQGCHYLFYDYAWAAEAWREVEGDARTRVRLLELVLDCRQADGSFLDTPINGRAYGTAMALLALDALQPPERGR